MHADYLTLSELLLQVKEAVSDAFPERCWVKGEIASLRLSGGHCYLELTENVGGRKVADTRAVIWKWIFPQLRAFFERSAGQELRAGLSVLVRVQVTFHEQYGFSLTIDDIDPAFTMGEQALRKKKAIEKLTAGGYLEMQRELALPALARHLAVITSKTAAGYGDFRKHLLENEAGYGFRLDLYEALMQGENAPASIISALLEAQETPYDAILILRGGGSEQDLACFDDYDLAVAIATCPVPVVTAIGHERDYHIADMVANRFVKTPTALADLFLEAFAAADAALDALAGRIRVGMQERVHAQEQAVQARFSVIRLGLTRRFSALETALQRQTGRIARGLAGKYGDAARKVDAALHRVQFAACARLSQEYSALALKEALIRSSDPRKILSLGYVLVTGRDHKVLKSVDRVNVGDRIGVRFADGALTAKVDEVYTEHVDQENIA